MCGKDFSSFTYCGHKGKKTILKLDLDNPPPLRQFSLETKLNKNSVIVLYIYFLNNYINNDNTLGDEACIPKGGVKPTFTERPVIRQSDEGNTIIFQCRLAGTIQLKLHCTICSITEHGKLKYITLYNL